MAILETSAPSAEQRRRHDLLLAGLDLLDQAIAVFDAAPKLVTWNKALIRLLDFPESMLRVGLPFEELVRFNAERGDYGEGDIEQLVAERVAAAHAFQPHYTERTRPNGTVLAIRGVPIPNLGFVTLWTDITDQRRYADVIKEQNVMLEARVRARTHELENANARLAHAKTEIGDIAEALRRSEGRLRLIIDSIPALIAYVDREETYQFVNRGYAEWFEIGKDEIVGKTIADVFGAEYYDQITPYLAIAKQGERVSYEYSRKLKGNRIVYARSVVVPEVDSAGQVLGFFVLSTDITEQKASQAALVQAQKMEAVGQLTGGLSHDFNNLLSIIIGNLSALKERTPEHDRASEFLNPALQAAQRGAELIKRLLTFSRRQTLEPSAVEICALVRSMTQLLALSLTESVHILTRLPEEPIHAFVDPHQLENALLNLALNARDAMPNGGDLTLAVSERRLTGYIARLVELPAGDYVQIDVTDTGSGIEPDALARVFEPFFTTKQFGRGSGLGLSMVYGFVRQSGGNIRIRSTPGTGTTVTFVLPRTQAPLQTTSTPTDPTERAQIRKGPVLLVEDEPEVRRIIRIELSALGYPVIEASNGPEAAALLENVPEIAILVTDTVMPGGIGGRDLAIRAKALRPDLPVLLITGYATEAALAGVADLDVPVLRKPFDRAGLDAALRALQAPLEAHSR
ncbi:MAG: PAS-domain containing protein [Rhodocyclaceae bacterium]|nr:PAS-domain containing protein [Rhodocyclaceae bacterium]MCL4759599.1 PAS-domain containing protein [Rhodocyclaceae bacterium]